MVTTLALVVVALALAVAAARRHARLQQRYDELDAMFENLCDESTAMELDLREQIRQIGGERA